MGQRAGRQGGVMQYMAIFKLDKNRTDCSGCPLMDCEDNCGLQPDNQNVESWDELLSKCPLVEVE